MRLIRGDIYDTIRLEIHVIVEKEVRKYGTYYGKIGPKLKAEIYNPLEIIFYYNFFDQIENNLKNNLNDTN